MRARAVLALTTFFRFWITYVLAETFLQLDEELEGMQHLLDRETIIFTSPTPLDLLTVLLFMSIARDPLLEIGLLLPLGDKDVLNCCIVLSPPAFICNIPFSLLDSLSILPILGLHSILKLTSDLKACLHNKHWKNSFL
jgi:hypothetical protein